MKMFILMYKFCVSYAWHSGTQGALAPRISTAWTPLPGGGLAQGFHKRRDISLLFVSGSSFGALRASAPPLTTTFMDPDELFVCRLCEEDAEEIYWCLNTGHCRFAFWGICFECWSGHVCVPWPAPTRTDPGAYAAAAWNP